ncbi:MAG TPA: hypothetical protein H9866_07005 [Candidatus Tidjanibacter gallistercoris]|nr:hypothetical protein [Candidatus Tidjanibacter gallistercoris]
MAVPLSVGAAFVSDGSASRPQYGRRLRLLHREWVSPPVHSRFARHVHFLEQKRQAVVLWY